MNIDEAIEGYRRVAEEYTFVHDIDGCLEVEQLVEWLRRARGADLAGRCLTRDIRELTQRLGDSEREIAKLRERIHELETEGSAAFYDASYTRDENAKLRELVRTIYMCSNIRCDYCEYEDGNTCSFDAEAELRELGLEVDG